MVEGKLGLHVNFPRSTGKGKGNWDYMAVFLNGDPNVDPQILYSS